MRDEHNKGLVIKFVKIVLFVALIFYIFRDWKVVASLYLILAFIQVIPMGPTVLLNAITGHLFIGGLVMMFFDWKIGIFFALLGFLVAMFHGWTVKFHQRSGH